MLPNGSEESPYEGVGPDDWLPITRRLIEEHPLNVTEIVKVTLEAWKGIFESAIGSRPFAIGVHIFPQPQIMGFLLHELIPLELNLTHPNFRRGDSASEKDIVYAPNDRYSIEIKTSSNPRNIFGNRSYTQRGSTAKKSKSGYTLAVNFPRVAPGEAIPPEITRIRFGWLDQEDWIGQRAATGQQARLSKEANLYKLILLYPSACSNSLG
jgi:hypothetical protein